VSGVLAAIGLVVVFAFGLSWVFTTMGMLMRSPNAVMNAGFMSIFPLTFLSNVYVDPDTLPAGLEAFVNANPISHLVSASRGLMAGSADGTDIVVVLATAAVLLGAGTVGAEPAALPRATSPRIRVRRSVRR